MKFMLLALLMFISVVSKAQFPGHPYLESYNGNVKLVEIVLMDFDGADIMSTTTQHYNADGLLDSAQIESKQMVSKFKYTYHANGRIKTIRAEVIGATVHEVKTSYFEWATPTTGRLVVLQNGDTVKNGKLVHAKSKHSYVVTLDGAPLVEAEYDNGAHVNSIIEHLNSTPAGEASIRFFIQYQTFERNDNPTTARMHEATTPDKGYTMHYRYTYY